MTTQTEVWNGAFGEAYTRRNKRNLEALEELFTSTIGITRAELNERFVGDVDRDARILEVGCNIGNQLLMLHEMGFTDLTGVDVQAYALDEARENCPFATFHQAGAGELPFEDASFDLVFTSGVLIHISPADLPAALREIARVSKRFVWGYEFHNDEMVEIEYRDHDDLHWKGDYARRYLEEVPGLEIDRFELFPWTEGENVDVMFRLRKI